MTSRVYTLLLALAAVLVSVTGVYFSVSGLVHLFSGSPNAVAVMATALEFSKFVVVGFLYRYWGHIHRPLRAYLCFAILILMVITSVGIYGYLSNAYQVSSLEFRTQTLAIKALENENGRVRDQIKELQNFVEQIPASRISRKFEFQREYDPKIQALRERSEEIVREIDGKHQTMLSTNTKLGPVTYLADAFHTDIDNVVKYLIIVFVSVFDPLAVCLVFSLNLLIRLREKYRGDDYKIGARSLTSPVDHRYSKIA